jgi:hypothetical protein
MIEQGDIDFATTVGTMLSFLPQENFFKGCLKETPTVYHVLKIVDTIANLKMTLRTLRFHTCKTGTCIISEDFCNCGESRWKDCNQSCYSDEGVSVCSHTKVPVKSFWYMPVRDRIEGLLRSDVANFFLYEDLRPKPFEVSNVQFIYYVLPLNYHLLPLYYNCFTPSVTMFLQFLLQHIYNLLTMFDHILQLFTI